jgi:hypothetical protein
MTPQPWSRCVYNLTCQTPACAFYQFTNLLKCREVKNGISGQLSGHSLIKAYYQNDENI